MSDSLPPPIYVDDRRSLSKLRDRLLRQPAIAVDCEANTLFSYLERLCLLQISTKARDYLVDPIAGLDLGGLAPVFADPGIMKVFHSAEYDVLLLKRAHPFELRGLFDTKIAAQSLGCPSPGLASVLDEWLGVRIDKKYQRSDWGKRPLTEGQMDYARRDTRYLIELAERVRERLSEAGSPHVEEVAAECRRLETLEPEPRGFDPDAYARIKGVSKLGPVQCRAMKELCRARDEIAQQRDLPLFKVIANDALLALARAHPRSVQELRRSKALPEKLCARYGEAIIEALERASGSRPIKRLPKSEPAPEDRLSPRARQRFEALRRWRRRVADGRGTDASLVLNRSTMVGLSQVDPPPRDRGELVATELLEGWRIESYGAEILEALGNGVG